MPTFYRFFLGWEGSTLLKETKKKQVGTLIPTSLLEDLGNVPGVARKTMVYWGLACGWVSVSEFPLGLSRVAVLVHLLQLWFPTV